VNIVEENVFVGQSIRLDYSKWINCVFKDCEIIAKIGDFDLIGCEFHGCKLTLKGEAQTVARLMYLFYPDKIPLIFPEGDPGPLADKDLIFRERK